MKYDLMTKILHWGIALAVSVQLLTSLLMEAPEPGEMANALEAALFEAHEMVGLVAFALLAARWLWGMTGHAMGGWQHLFPWLFTTGRRELIEDIGREVPRWFHGELPGPSEGDAIAKTVHGLGLTVASIMAVTGVMLFLLVDEGGKATGLAHDVEEIHEAFSLLMWVFLGGHFAMALIHQALGHGVLGKMFLFRNR